MGGKMTDFGEEMKELIKKGMEEAMEAIRQTTVKNKMGKDYADPSKLVTENDEGGREMEAGGERTPTKETSSNFVNPSSTTLTLVSVFDNLDNKSRVEKLIDVNMEVSQPAISAPQTFDEIPVKVCDVQIPAITLHAPNSVVFHVESIKRALTPVLSNKHTKNDKEMVYNLHDNEYGKVLVKPYVNYKNVNHLGSVYKWYHLGSVLVSPNSALQGVLGADELGKGYVGRSLANEGFGTGRSGGGHGVGPGLLVSSQGGGYIDEMFVDVYAKKDGVGDATQKNVIETVDLKTHKEIECLDVGCDVLHTFGNRVASHQEFLSDTSFLPLARNHADHISSLSMMRIRKGPTSTSAYGVDIYFYNIGTMNVHKFDPGGDTFNNCQGSISRGEKNNKVQDLLLLDDSVVPGLESYAGHYVPQLSQAIVKHHWEKKAKSINLKGYMVGNALTDDFCEHLGLFQFKELPQFRPEIIDILSMLETVRSIFEINTGSTETYANKSSKAAVLTAQRNMKSILTKKLAPNSSTISMLPSVTYHTMKRPVTRSLTRKKPTKVQQRKAKNAPSSSNKHKHPEKTIFSFEGRSRKINSATICGSVSKSEKKKSSRTEPHKLHFSKRNNADETCKVTDSSKKEDHMESSSGLKNGIGGLCGFSLKGNRDTYRKGNRDAYQYPILENTDNLGDNYESMFPENVDEEDMVPSLKNIVEP